MFLTERLSRLVWWCLVGVLLVDDRLGLWVRSGRGMGSRGLRAVWRGRDIAWWESLGRIVLKALFWLMLFLNVFNDTPSHSCLVELPGLCSTEGDSLWLWTDAFMCS